MRRFLVLLKKELAELITPQVILPFVVVILMFGMLGQTMSSLSAEQESTFPIAVADRDGGPFAGVVLDALERSGFEPKLIDDAPDEDTVTAILDDLDANIVIEIPEGFSASLAAGEPQRIESWTRVRNFSFMGNNDISSFAGAMEAVNSAVASMIAAEAAPDVPAQLLQRPVTADERVVVGDRTAETSAMTVMAFVTQQTTFIPIVLFLVIMFASQMIATAIATERRTRRSRRCSPTL